MQGTCHSPLGCRWRITGKSSALISYLPVPANTRTRKSRSSDMPAPLPHTPAAGSLASWARSPEQGKGLRPVLVLQSPWRAWQCLGQAPFQHLPDWQGSPHPGKHPNDSTQRTLPAEQPCFFFTLTIPPSVRHRKAT